MLSKMLSLSIAPARLLAIFAFELVVFTKASVPNSSIKALNEKTRDLADSRSIGLRFQRTWSCHRQVQRALMTSSG